MHKIKTHPKQHFYKRPVFLWTIGSIVVAILLIALWFRLTPWPGAMIIRIVFDKGGAETLQKMEKHAPGKPITLLSNQMYRSNDSDARLDVYYPASIASSNTRLPTIIWTHGGAWLSGDKTNDGPYFKLLAAEGYTVIAPNYSLAPDHTYPTPVQQLNDMYKYIQEHAAYFHIDTNKLFLAGDSAGAQLSAQMAALITNPDYAREVSISPNMKPEQLRGVILNCGIYQMKGLTEPNPTLPKIVGWGDDVSVWAYSGTKDFDDPIIQQMSPYFHATKDFPPTYISGGNGDPLTKAQSIPLAGKLESLGVPVTALFYADDHQPSLPHEYQFNLDNDDGQNALKETLEFIEAQAQ